MPRDDPVTSAVLPFRELSGSGVNVSVTCRPYLLGSD
jgi:hypothetical protein